MKIAIPIAGGRLTAHFGHCERFALIDADPTSGEIVSVETVEPPPHEPGRYPAWLAELGVHQVIAGGMGEQAMNLFSRAGIQAMVGAPCDEPEALVRRFLRGELIAGGNACDH